MQLSLRSAESEKELSRLRERRRHSAPRKQSNNKKEILSLTYENRRFLNKYRSFSVSPSVRSRMATAAGASDPAALLRQLETAAQILLASFSIMNAFLRSAFFHCQEIFICCFTNQLFETMSCMYFNLHSNPLKFLLRLPPMSSRWKIGGRPRPSSWISARLAGLSRSAGT